MPIQVDNGVRTSTSCWGVRDALEEMIWSLRHTCGGANGKLLTHLCVQLLPAVFKGEILQAHAGVSGERTMGRTEKRKGTAVLQLVSKK